MTNKLFNSPEDLKCSQIVCLDYENLCLFAEVIQVIESRKMCWVRPLLMQVKPANLDDDMTMGEIWDLRESIDLVLPITLFRAALDTELLPLLPYLYQTEETEQITQNDLGFARQQLNILVRQLWEKYPDAFLGC
ncbi:MAG: hypothetical protein ACRC2J_09530 [Microcoleaceae cyanobacterium]